MSADTVAADQLISFVRRIEALEDQGKTISEDKSEVYKEARGNGFDTKIIRKVVAKRRLGSAERDEQDAQFQLYWDAIHGVVRAHVENIEEFAGEQQGAARPQPHRSDAVPVAAANAGGENVAAPTSDLTLGNIDNDDGKARDGGLAPISAVESGASHFISAFTIGHVEPVTAAPPAVTEAGDRSAASPSAAPVADHSKPNPICRDPDDCGVYASWHLPCERCRREAKQARAA